MGLLMLPFCAAIMSLIILAAELAHRQFARAKSSASDASLPKNYRGGSLSTFMNSVQLVCSMGLVTVEIYAILQFGSDSAVSPLIRYGLCVTYVSPNLISRTSLTKLSRAIHHSWGLLSLRQAGLIRLMPV